MMKKFIKLIIVVIVLCGIIGIGNAFTSELPTFEEKEFDNESEKNKEETSIEEKNTTEENKNENNQSVKENTNNPQQSENKNSEQDNIPQDTEIPTTPTVWDSLGITEYEYYNTPAHSWAKLQFKIDDYGSREATENACREYGNNNKPEDKIGYWCRSVDSFSGKYLGEEIDFY